MADGWYEPAVLERARLAPLVTDAVDRCQRACERGAFPHALLLVGPVGLGRELAAVEIAAILVSAGLDAPWLDDPAARRVRAGNHPDVILVRPLPKKSAISIEQVREIIDAASGRPFEGQHRVWILDGVEPEGLTIPAANAFLKILEEPPAHVVFLLLAANPTAVLATIRSRCQRLLLPGTVGATRALADDTPFPEIGPHAAAAVDAARHALLAAFEGEPRGLIGLPEHLDGAPSMLATVAAAAVDLAAADADRADDLTRLAADALRLERRAAALNLDPGRQLLARLMSFYQDLP